MSTLSRYTNGVRASLRYNASAFGYSVMITATFGALNTLIGSPALPDLFLFVVGATAAFAVVDMIVSDFFRNRLRGEPSEVVALGSAMAILSVSSAVGVGALTGTFLRSWIGWLLGPFGATVVYLAVVGIEMALAEAWQATAAANSNAAARWLGRPVRVSPRRDSTSGRRDRRGAPK